MAPGPDGPAGQSLEDFAGSMFGDLADDPGTTDDGSSAVAAGAPPAEHAESPSGAPPAGSEAQPDAERAGAPPADAATPRADQAPPAAAAASAASDTDPLAGATPFTYTVNGETRTLDGIKVLPGLGGIIEADKIPDLMRRLGERDHLFETSQAQYRERQELERLTEWTQSRADGSKETLTGAPAIQARMVSHANALAELQTLKAALSDPAQFQALLAWDDASNTVQLNPAALESLATRAELLAMKLQQGIASRFSTATTRPSAAPAAEPDLQAVAPNVVATVVKQLNVTGLTDKDTAKLAAMVPRYIRPATEVDRQQNPMLKLGEKLIDAAFFDEVKYLAELRAEAAKTTKATVDANTTNAARLAAAARGTRTPGTPARPAPANQPPANNRAKDAGDAWDLMERLSNRALTGQPG